MDKSKFETTDQQGEPIGKAMNYVNRFKKLGESSDTFKPEEFKESVSISKSLPSDWSNDTEKDIIFHYYKKFGNKTCSDFESVSGRIASAINRLYKKNFSLSDIKEKLGKYISVEDIKSFEEEEEKKVLPTKKTSVKVDLKEGNYKYIKNISKLTNEQLDLCGFINQEYLCFSSDESGEFYLTVFPEKLDSFDKLFDFNEKEKMMFEIFKEQINDEHKAKKLVLLSRNMNEEKKVIKKSRKNKSNLF